MSMKYFHMTRHVCCLYVLVHVFRGFESFSGGNQICICEWSYEMSSFSPSAFSFSSFSPSSSTSSLFLFPEFFGKEGNTAKDQFGRDESFGRKFCNKNLDSQSRFSVSQKGSQFAWGLEQSEFFVLLQSFWEDQDEEEQKQRERERNLLKRTFWKLMKRRVVMRTQGTSK